MQYAMHFLELPTFFLGMPWKVCLKRVGSSGRDVYIPKTSRCPVLGWEASLQAIFTFTGQVRVLLLFDTYELMDGGHLGFRGPPRAFDECFMTFLGVLSCRLDASLYAVDTLRLKQQASDYTAAAVMKLDYFQLDRSMQHALCSNRSYSNSNGYFIWKVNEKPA